jgi:hypothetical protein
VNRIILAAAFAAAAAALAGCAAPVTTAASTPPASPAAYTPPPSPSPTAPYFPPGPVCKAFSAGLAVWQQAGADDTATLATFTRFARELRAESRLAADDQPLGADLATAARVVAADGKAGAAGGTVNTTGLADDLENVKIDCGSY